MPPRSRTGRASRGRGGITMVRATRQAIAWAALAAIGLSCARPAGAQEAWLGIYSEPVALPDVSREAGGPSMLLGATAGLRVTAVFPGSPADRGGVLPDDVIVALAGKPFTCPAESLPAELRSALAQRLPGDVFSMRVVRDGESRRLEIDGRPAGTGQAKRFWIAPQTILDSLRAPFDLRAEARQRQAVVDLPVVLALRPEARWPPARPNDAIFPLSLYPESAAGRAFRDLAASRGLSAENADLLDRLARCHGGRDPYRLDCMIFVHRDPFRLEAVSRHLAAALGSARQARDLALRIAPLLVPAHSPTMSAVRRLTFPARPAAGGESIAGHADSTAAVGDLIAQVLEVFDEARGWHERAFASLNDEERAFLAAHLWTLSEVFAGEIYLHLDEDRDRLRDHLRLIDLAARVDFAALGEAAARLALLCDPEWAQAAGERVRAAFGEKAAGDEVILDYPSAHGRLLVCGTGRRWHRESDVAFLLDLGGDDFYTGNSGGSQGWELPLAVCIDLAGDDAYESTRPSCQGTGCLGAGGLLDLAGNDEYVGPQWCQGTGYFGIGWLHDRAGDDVYRGRSFCQGVGLFGAGVLLDDAGRDRYEGDSHVQGVGLPLAVGALIDRAGDDEYYAKGLRPTGYGDPGIFDGWSQGCGIGFRTLASGGLGLLVDGGGRDRMEAGNFSQGGGYYYGWGIVDARGPEDDLYIGSRYNQGFSAHQAVGTFLEEGGDDRYTTRQGVAQGVAWDECVTLFVDSAGDDRYEGGEFFSQGAAAHNAICVFQDLAGRDSYAYALGPARAGGNDYHGGTSFALFVDEGGAPDLYESARAENDTLRYEPEHGWVLDLPAGLEQALDQGAMDLSR